MTSGSGFWAHWSDTLPAIILLEVRLKKSARMLRRGTGDLDIAIITTCYYSLYSSAHARIPGNCPYLEQQ
jgi:hypothetical protein